MICNSKVSYYFYVMVMQNLGKKMGSKRSIFEEVSELETKSVNSNIKTGIIEMAEHGSDRAQIRRMR